MFPIVNKINLVKQFNVSRNKEKKKKMCKCKESLGILGLVLFFCLSLSPTAKANEVNSNLKTEEIFNIEIGTPVIKAGVINKNSFSHKYQYSKDKETLTQTVTMNPLTLQTVFEVPISMPKDGKLVLYKDGSEKSYNVGNIYDKNRASIGTVSVEATTNFRGERANIITEIKEPNILLVRVDKKNLVGPLTFTMEITSSSLFTYFSEVKWIDRGSFKSLSLSQKPYLTNANNLALDRVKRIDAWDKVLKFHGNDPQWSNTNGMKNQFNCHYDFATKKSDWNLEPQRPNVSYFSTILAGCNP